MLGADWRPTSGLSLSLLGRLGRNSEPISTASAENSEEISFRGRWRINPTWFTTLVYRRRAREHSDDFDSDSNVDSASGSVAYATEPVDGSLTVTYQGFKTQSETSFFDFDRSTSGRISEEVSFHSRNVIVALDLGWRLTPILRLRFFGHYTRTRGDYEADYGAASLIGEYDLAKEVTAGLALRAWRLNELGRNIDDYRTEALEISLTWRF